MCSHVIQQLIHTNSPVMVEHIHTVYVCLILYILLKSLETQNVYLND